jgi:hypothetical protein
MKIVPSPASPLRRSDGRPIVRPSFVDGLVTVAEALFATEAGPPPSERLDWLALELEDFLARAGARARWMVRLALWAVLLLAPLSIGRLRGLGSLAVPERVRALCRLESSRLGAPVLAVKALLCVLYYEHPDASREIGFDADCLAPGGGPA